MGGAPRVKIHGASMADLKKFRHAVRGSKGVEGVNEVCGGTLNKSSKANRGPQHTATWRVCFLKLKLEL